MGGIWLSKNGLVTSTSEIVGYKSGLALNKQKIFHYASEYHRSLITGPPEAIIRIRSEEYEQLIADVLHGIGNLSSPAYGPVGMHQFHRYKNNRILFVHYSRVLKLFHKVLNEALSKAGQTHSTEEPIAFTTALEFVQEMTALSILIHENGADDFDEGAFIELSKREAGAFGEQLAREMLDDFHRERHRSPWGLYREVQWADRQDLEALFKSSSLVTQYGKFLDQRFIDYLSKNFDDIDKIHWRKFEGLAGEYFTRQGLNVAMGPGRNDGGVDLRISDSANSGSTILVQCKREKNKIEKVIVKALWADVIAEGAKSGLIVTTSALAPGAKKVQVARSYPIQAAERPTLKKWLEQMRTPRAGVFMGE
jgi:restriction system protein